MEHFFSPNSSGHLRSDAHQSQIIGGDVDVDHTQTIGRDTIKLMGGIYPPIPPGFGTPDGGYIPPNNLSMVFICIPPEQFDSGPHLSAGFRLN